MNDLDARVASLLDSPLGCAFLIVADASGLTPKAAAEPAVSLRVGVAALNEITVWRDGHNAIVNEVLQRGRQCADLARAILEQPSAAWWFGPLDVDRQVWVARDGRSPDQVRLVKPDQPPSHWERYAQKSAAGLYTSTLIQDTTSVFAALDEGVGDFICDFPAACWRLDAAHSARTFEIDGPLAWHDLCVRYPATGDDGRLVPNWSAVAVDWDAIHLTFGGLLTSEQVRVASPAGWSEHWAWDAEQTLWLRWVFTASERLTDHERASSPVDLTYPRLDASVGAPLQRVSSSYLRQIGRWVMPIGRR